MRYNSSRLKDVGGSRWKVSYWKFLLIFWTSLKKRNCDLWVILTATWQDFFLWYFGHNFFLFSDSEPKFLTRKSICRKLINYLHIFFSHAFHIKLILSFQKKIPGGLKLVDKSQNIVMVINTCIMKIILNCKSVRSLWVHSFKSLSSHLEVERVTRDDSRFKKGGV